MKAEDAVLAFVLAKQKAGVDYGYLQPLLASHVEFAEQYAHEFAAEQLEEAATKYAGMTYGTSVTKRLLADAAELRKATQ